MTDSTHVYDVSTFRRLLLAAFNAADLRRFCEDRPAFRPIVARFGTQTGLDDMVDEVLHYCDTHRLLAELEAAIEQENPAQYAKFESFLRSGSEALAIKILKPGSSLLKGKYRIERHLGRGGFGSVYLARDTLLGEQVAVKELVPGLVGDDSALKRFLIEAKTTLRLAYPHLVHTRDVFAEGSNYYMVMEYMPGGSLEDRLKQQKKVSPEEAVRIVAEVCEGLAYAHAQGVVHCDLKPGNILFGADGEAKVADFGVAHVSEQMLTRTWTTSGSFMAGTLPYMSPEQADGVRDDPRIDIYALGAILYRALTGRAYLEFDERNTPRAQFNNMQRIITEQPQPPSTYDRRIPAWLDAVVLKAVAKRPEDRHASAGEMRSTLMRGEAGAAVPSAPETNPPAQGVLPAARSMFSRQPRALVWALAGAACIVAVALIVGLVAMFGGRPRGGQDGTPAATLVAKVQETLLPTRTALPPTRTSIPPTDTPLLTETLVPQTATLAPPTVTRIPPTAMPTPKTPQAGTTQTRAKDGMVMVYVPAGNFLMGSTDADKSAAGDEKPQHTVYLDAFWIDRTEVTNAQYHTCVAEGVCWAPTTCDRGDPTYGDASKADHPVVCVSWDDAQTYCQWAGARLPIEAEWEKAARGADGRILPWGNDFDCHKGNFDDEQVVDPYVVPGGPNCDGYAQTAPAGSYPAGASPYGVMDMAGNVFEWVSDWYDSGYYSRSPDHNPRGPESGQYRVLRGGSWHDNWNLTRTANRYNPDPASRVYDIGFRCGATSSGE